MLRDLTERSSWQERLSPFYNQIRFLLRGTNIADELRNLASRNQPLPPGTPNLISRYTGSKSREVPVSERIQPPVVNGFPTGGLPSSTVENLANVLNLRAERLKSGPAVSPNSIKLTVDGIQEPLKTLAQAVSASSDCKTNCGCRDCGARKDQQAQQIPVPPPVDQVARIARSLAEISGALKAFAPSVGKPALQPGPYVFHVVSNDWSGCSAIERIDKDGKLQSVQVKFRQAPGPGKDRPNEAPAIEMKDCKDTSDIATTVQLNTITKFGGFEAIFDQKEPRRLFSRKQSSRLVITGVSTE